jgi:hypothetical protein
MQMLIDNFGHRVLAYNRLSDGTGLQASSFTTRQLHLEDVRSRIPGCGSAHHSADGADGSGASSGGGGDSDGGSSSIGSEDGRAQIALSPFASTSDGDRVCATPPYFFRELTSCETDESVRAYAAELKRHGYSNRSPVYVWSNTIIDYVEVNAERAAARARELKAASLKLSEEERIEWEDDDDASYDDEDEGERGGDGRDTGDTSSAVRNEDSHEETSELVNSDATKETARVNDRNNAAGAGTSASTTAQEHRDAAHRVKRVAADGVETGARGDEEDNQADLVHALTRAGAVQRPALLESVTRLHTFFYVGENMSGTHLHAHGAACSVSTGRKLWFMYNPDDYHCGLADVPKVRCALDVPCWTQRTAPLCTPLQCRASTPTMHIYTPCRPDSAPCSIFNVPARLHCFAKHLLRSARSRCR